MQKWEILDRYRRDNEHGDEREQNIHKVLWPVTVLLLLVALVLMVWTESAAVRYSLLLVIHTAFAAVYWYRVARIKDKSDVILAVLGTLNAVLAVINLIDRIDL